MNIIDYSIRLGKSLNKTDIGKDLKEKYHILLEERNTEEFRKHFDLFNQFTENYCIRNHFFGWVYSYETMKNLVNDSETEDRMLKETANYIFDNDVYKKMTDVCRQMGELSLKIFNKMVSIDYEDNDITELLKIPKVRRAIYDLQMAVDRSGIKLFLLKKYKEIQLDEEQLCLKNNNFIPYLDTKDPVHSDKSGSDKYSVYWDRMIFLQYIILMGIYVGFWDIQKELNQDNILEGDLTQPCEIKKGYLKHNCFFQELLMRETWIYKILTKNDNFYFLANKRVISLDKKESIVELTGIFYPKEDIDFFDREKIAV